jgi:hypothetical protein
MNKERENGVFISSAPTNHANLRPFRSDKYPPIFGGDLRGIPGDKLIGFEEIDFDEISSETIQSMIKLF